MENNYEFLHFSIANNNDWPILCKICAIKALLSKISKFNENVKIPGREKSASI